MDMFCFQCEEASKGSGCTVRGICGKSPEVAAVQDLLTWQLKGLAFWALRARELGINDPATNLFIAEALFTTITNVSFDVERGADWVRETITRRDVLRQQVQAAAGGTIAEDVPTLATWTPETDTLDELVRQGMLVGIMADPGMNEDIRSLRELLIYGLKGLAAYTVHAYVLDFADDSILHFLQEALVLTADANLDVDTLVGMSLKCGEYGVKSMALLDEANTTTYGTPEPTQVNLGVVDGPAILISGHDLRDLADLLEQTKGTGVNVYTHGEMLPAHAYPAFKKYDNLIGNYGGAWWQQQEQFPKFNGAILMTTNCIVAPRESYQDRIFTTGVVAYPGLPHIPENENGQQKDFSAVIAKALECGSPESLEEGEIPVGFAHATVLSVADKVIDAVKSGAIKRFVVMAGCDGRHKERQYYTDLAQNLPQDNVILTAGCAKYRYNKLELGDIGGIPRVLDAGQCNDSYSLAVIAMKLAEAFELEDINELPVSYDIAWYEQKAVVVLLALLHLGVKNIRLGANLPAFVSPNVLNVLVENFNIKPIASVEADLVAIAAGD